MKKLILLSIALSLFAAAPLGADTNVQNIATDAFALDARSGINTIINNTQPNYPWRDKNNPQDFSLNILGNNHTFSEVSLNSFDTVAGEALIVDFLYADAGFENWLMARNASDGGTNFVPIFEAYSTPQFTPDPPSADSRLVWSNDGGDWDFRNSPDGQISNPHSVQMGQPRWHTYQSDFDPNVYIVTIEDTKQSKSDMDYNDGIFLIRRVNYIPEPTSMLAGALLSMVGGWHAFRRRRKGAVAKDDQ